MRAEEIETALNGFFPDPLSFIPHSLTNPRIFLGLSKP